MKKDSKVFVAGHNGMVGSAIYRRLLKAGYRNILTRTSSTLNLTDSIAVSDFFREQRPEVVFLAAGKVGGILANTKQPVEFLTQNLDIQNNVMMAAKTFGVEKLVFLGSSCIYPKYAAQPIKESSLLTGPLEETNAAYAIAKIAGLRLVRSMRSEYKLPWISVMPCNVYGPGDNYDPLDSHVMAALIKRYVEATRDNSAEVVNWGTGRPRREFIHVDDLADAIFFVFENYNEDEHINIGVGTDIEIRELAEQIAETVGFKGSTVWDETKPDGTPQKLLDVSKLTKLGWEPKISLFSGVEMTVNEYLKLLRSKTALSS